jgi:membrane dipeptidase
MIAAQSGDLCKILSAADITRARHDGKIGLIYGFQNAAMVGDSLERIDVFADLGVRIIQLTYNPANQIGDGSMAPLNRGLTDFGRDVVSRLNDNRIMVDLSHSGEKTCLEAARVSRQPVSINHTGCRAVTESPRNKTDEELRLVAEKGGFVGIYFMPFLSPTMHVKADDIVRHIEHAVQICGEDHVGIGTDGGVTQVDDLAAYTVELGKEVEQRKKLGIAATGEGADTYKFAVDMRGVNQFYDLADRLEKRGFSTSRIEKILGGNFIRYGRDVWGG